MKRSTARQLVGQLADLRHAARCSALRAAAGSKTMGQSPAEPDGQAADPRDAAQDGSRRESFVGAAHDSHK